MLFSDRTDAGQKLAVRLAKLHPEFKENSFVIVLALPRGGVPVAFEIAKALHAPLDLIITHKLGAPGNEEFAIGALAEDGSTFLDSSSSAHVSRDYLKEEIRHQLVEIKKRIKKYRMGKALPAIQDKIAILVDDGIATGNTMQAAIALCEKARAARVIVAVPVLPQDTLNSFQKKTEVVCIETPSPFFAIGRFYERFDQLTDEEVRSYLAPGSGAR